MRRRFSAVLAVFVVVVSVLAGVPAEADTGEHSSRSVQLSGLGGLLSVPVGDDTSAVSKPSVMGSSALATADVGREPSSVASRGVPPLLVPEQVVSFGADGAVQGDASEGALGGVRLKRSGEDVGVGVDLAVLGAENAAEVSSLGFGFELVVDQTPSAAAGGNPPSGTPGRGRSDTAGDLGARSGWELEFDLGLFAGVLSDVGRVQFEVGLGCSPDGGCQRTEVLPSSFDFERGVVVVDIPVNVLAGVAHSSVGHGHHDSETADEADSTTATSVDESTSTTDPATSTTEGDVPEDTATTDASTSTTETTVESSTSTSTSTTAREGETTTTTVEQSTSQTSAGGAVGGEGLGIGGVVPSVAASLGWLVTGSHSSSVYFGASGAAAGPQGDYSASALGSLSSWQVGLQTGSAELSYDVPLPAPIWGHVPDVSFSYSSGRVDGMNSAANTQPSVVGLGWSGPSAVITRETRGCATTGGSAETAWEGNLCLPLNSRLDGFAMSFNGVSGPLVRLTQSTSGIAHPEVSGAVYWEYRTQMASDLRVRRVEHTARRGTSDDNGDHWVTWWEVTGGDGTVYVFGREFAFLTVSSADYGQPSTIRQRYAHGAGDRLESAQVVPVYYPGEPSCTDSLCDVAVAWHLDQVFDTASNVARYRYGSHVNYYEPRVNGVAKPNRAYEREVRLWFIDYGERFPSVASAPGDSPVYRVVFDYEPRTDANGDYVDAPVDLDCGASDNCADGAPSFYSKSRLSKVRTLYRDKTSGVKTTAREFVFNHDFPVAPNEGGLTVKSGQKLWLTGIDANDAPQVTYAKTWLDNRVNPSGNAMQMPRVGSVTNESGGTVTFTYGQSHPPTNNSSDYCYRLGTSNVRRLCDMYVAWDAFTGSGGWVWWHKWKVLQTVETAGSGQGGSDSITLDFAYEAPEWAYTGKTGMGTHHSSQCRYGYGCNIWNDFRGHRKVTVTDATGAKVEHFFYTGMENDRAEPLGNTGWLRDDTSAIQHQLATITGPDGVSRANSFELAGRPLGTRTYSGLNQQLSHTVTTYGMPASQSNSSTALFIDTPLAYQLDYQVDKSWVNYSPGHATTIHSQVDTYFDNKGLVTRVTDQGDKSTATDDRTTFHYYAQNTGNVWVVNTPSLIATRAGASGTFSWQGMLAATAYEYDGGVYGAAPTFGFPTMIKEQIETNATQDPVWEWTEYTYMPRGAVMKRSRRGRNGTGTPEDTNYGFDWTHGHLVTEDGPLGSQDNYTYDVHPRLRATGHDHRPQRHQHVSNL